MGFFDSVFGDDEVLFFILVFLLLFSGKLSGNLRGEPDDNSASSVLFFILVFLLLFINNDFGRENKYSAREPIVPDDNITNISLDNTQAQLQ